MAGRREGALVVSAAAAGALLPVIVIPAVGLLRNPVHFLTKLDWLPVDLPRAAIIVGLSAAPLAFLAALLAINLEPSGDRHRRVWRALGVLWAAAVPLGGPPLLNLPLAWGAAPGGTYWASALASLAVVAAIAWLWWAAAGPLEQSPLRARRWGALGAAAVVLGLNLVVQASTWAFYFDPGRTDTSLFAVPLLILPFSSVKWLPIGYAAGWLAGGGCVAKSVGTE